MKNICLILIIFICAANAKGQTTTAEQLASKIAGKMKDSLGLSEAQRASIYDINIRLHNQKTTIRVQYNGSPSLGAYLQQVENMRDSLYKPVLGDSLYVLYKQSKSKLVRNN